MGVVEEVMAEAMAEAAEPVGDRPATPAEGMAICRATALRAKSATTVRGNLFFPMYRPPLLI